MTTLSFISLVNPWLALGGVLIASPIIIHLLNKRRFRIVEWAAMDFLLDADRRNRRRVRLENLLLLLLRCLAVLLIALLLARPFAQATGLAAVAGQGVRYERIIVLDDSPSMTAKTESRSALDHAKAQILAMVEQRARDRSGDTITLIRTSAPTEPVMQGRLLNEEAASMLRRQFDGAGADDPGLEPTDQPARLAEALVTVQDQLAQASGHPNRIVYVLTDRRQVDWLAGREESGSAVELMRQIGAEATETFVVDMAGDDTANLAVIDVQPREKVIASNRLSTFAIRVHNFGLQTARDVKLVFEAAGVQLTRTITEVPAGADATATISFTFAEPGAHEVIAEIDWPDQIPADNRYSFAAQVQRGANVLIVDGSPAPSPERWYRAESAYLVNALDPLPVDEPGAAPSSSGFRVVVVSETEFEALPQRTIDRAQVIILANVYRFSEARLAEITRFVEAGGGLIVFLGDKVDADFYNKAMFAAGQGVLPAQLVEIQGDARREQGRGFTLTSSTHPALGVVRQDQIADFENSSYVKVFQWWQTQVPAALVSEGKATLLATYGGEGGPPAIIERSYGDGRVILITTTADTEWNNWGDFPSYSLLTPRLSQYVARTTADRGNIRVGEPLVVTLDPTVFVTDSDVKLRPPQGQPISRRPVTDETGKTQLQFGGRDEGAGVTMAGFYRLELIRRDGEPRTRLYAANIDRSESDLTRASEEDLAKALGEQVRLVEGLGEQASVQSARAEYWRPLAFVLIAVLGLETFLGWMFGQRR